MQKTTLLSLICLIFSTTLVAQWHAGVFAGGAGYIGDLNGKPFVRLKPAIGASINYEISDRVMLRSGLTFGKIEGGDKYSGNQYLKENRNLSFTSPVTELSLVGELTVFNLYNIRWSPYGFAGIALYRFNPYIKDSGQKIYLQPLSTEGQGTSAYPQRKPYGLTEFAIPFGGGIKYNVNENMRLAFEVGIRRLFTDYLDDVSGFYADEAVLFNERGPRSVKYAYRGDEVPGDNLAYPDNGYPVKDAERGNPKSKDWYYFTGLHLTFRIGGGYGKTDASKNKNGFGCPRVPM